MTPKLSPCPGFVLKPKGNQGDNLGVNENVSVTTWVTTLFLGFYLINTSKSPQK